MATHLVVLDNEALQALGSVVHPKHRRAIAHVEALQAQRARSSSVVVIAPTTVRVEAGWDRTDAAWAIAGQAGIADHALDRATANRAAAIRSATGVSPADAHIGAVIQAAEAARITVLTSDPGDMKLVAGTVPINAVRL